MRRPRWRQPPSPAAGRFGGLRPELPGVTANLSETGLFIITSQPCAIGAGVEIDLRFAEIPILLAGESSGSAPSTARERALDSGSASCAGPASTWISFQALAT